MLKILQASLQQYMNCELPDVQAGFRKGRGTRDQIANICWIIEKAREFQKNIYFHFIDYPSYHNKYNNNENYWNTVFMLVAQPCLTVCNPWTVSCQAPLSMEFSRQDTGVGCHSLLQGIFQTQKLNPGLWHCGQIFYHLATWEAQYCENCLNVPQKYEVCKCCWKSGANRLAWLRVAANLKILQARLQQYMNCELQIQYWKAQ